MAASLTELLARVPRAKVDDRVRVVLAVHCLAPGEAGTVTASEVRQHLTLHLGKRAPKNVRVTLGRAAPYVEPARGEGRKRRWHLTGSGTRFLQELLGVSLAVGPAVAALDFKDLHERVQHAAGELLRDGHLDDAVGRAAKALNLMVRHKTGRTRDGGVAMMNQVFNINPNGEARLHLTDLADETQRDEQEGVRFLMAGVQAAVANVDKHAELGVDAPAHAMELLAMISFLARVVDRCHLVPAEPRRPA